MADEIRHIAVIGAGTMGHGIALVAAQAGLSVSLNDMTPELVERGLARVRQGLETAVAKGKLSEADATQALTRVAAVPDLAVAVADADLIVEAVPENMVLKRETLRAVGAAAKPQALLASNTSSLSITELQMATSHPERVVGMHFFNPVAVMKLVEVVRGERTDDAAVAAACAVAQRMGKETIVVRDSPGFATSRLGIALGNEAMRMLDEGVASAADIDRAMELGYRHPMGPLRLSDLVGLDVRLAITEHLYRELGTDTFRPPAVLRRLVRAGKLGQKTGEGFYRHDR